MCFHLAKVSCWSAPRSGRSVGLESCFPLSYSRLFDPNRAYSSGRTSNWLVLVGKCDKHSWATNDVLVDDVHSMVCKRWRRTSIRASNCVSMDFKTPLLSSKSFCSSGVGLFALKPLFQSRMAYHDDDVGVRTSKSGNTQCEGARRSAVGRCYYFMARWIKAHPKNW